tara:strand:- start:2023 stop:2313 length:291 start_codon:yes stop_codon:yes gene_type:complete
MSEHTILTHLTQADDLPVRINFDYQPYEPETNDYPGCHAEITICAVWVDLPRETHSATDHDLLPVLTKLAQTQLRAACWEYMELLNLNSDDRGNEE